MQNTSATKRLTGSCDHVCLPLDYLLGVLPEEIA
jgi:hypothetical protein